MILLRLGALAPAIAAVGLSTAGANRPKRQAAGMRHAHAAALRVGALAGARFNLAPQAVIAAKPGPAGATPADADGACRLSVPPISATKISATATAKNFGKNVFGRNDFGSMFPRLPARALLPSLPALTAGAIGDVPAQPRLRRHSASRLSRPAPAKARVARAAATESSKNPTPDSPLAVITCRLRTIGTKSWG